MSKEFDAMNLGNVTKPPCEETKGKMQHLRRKRHPAGRTFLDEKEIVLEYAQAVAWSPFQTQATSRSHSGSHINFRTEGSILTFVLSRI